MDNIKIRERGLYEEYLPETIHKDVIYFATDTHQIFLNGVNYGNTEIDQDVVELNHVFETIRGMEVTILNQREDIDQLEDGALIKANITTLDGSENNITYLGKFHKDTTYFPKDAFADNITVIGEIILENMKVRDVPMTGVIAIADFEGTYSGITLAMPADCPLVIILPNGEGRNGKIYNYESVSSVIDFGRLIYFLDLTDNHVDGLYRLISEHSHEVMVFEEESWDIIEDSVINTETAPFRRSTRLLSIWGVDGVVTSIKRVDSVRKHTYSTDNPHKVTAAQVGLGNVDNTSDDVKPLSYATKTALNGKVDKVEGKGLSDTNFTLEEKDKLAGIESGAQANIVTSVAGKTGNVSLNSQDVGLGNVTNDALLKRSELGLPDGVAALNSDGYIDFDDLHLSNCLGSLLLVAEGDTDDYTNRDNASPSLVWSFSQLYAMPRVLLPVFTGEGIAHNPKSYLVVTERGLASREAVLTLQIELLREDLRSFLEDSDLSDTTINKWKELENFLSGITDTSTLTGVIQDAIAANNATMSARLDDIETKINTVWANYVSTLNNN